MADSEHVLCDLLRFLKSKYGKVADKPLKSSTIDFYKVEDIVIAKHQLFNEVEHLQLVQLSTSRSRAGEASRVMDDIGLFTVFIAYMS